MGGKGGGGGSSTNAYDQLAGNIAHYNYMGQTGVQYAIARDLARIMGTSNPFDAADPLQFNADALNKAKANYDVSELPTYEPLFGLSKQSLEDQYQQAKKNLIATTPSGGNLAGAMTRLESSRAAQMGAVPAQLGSNILQDWINKAFSWSTGMNTSALSSLNSSGANSASMQASKLAAQTAANNASYGLLGSVGEGIGKAVGAGK